MTLYRVLLSTTRGKAVIETRAESAPAAERIACVILRKRGGHRADGVVLDATVLPLA